MAGWIRWENSKPVEHIMVRVADDRPLPKRDDLGDVDKTRWEKDSSGELRDPWQFTNYLPLMNNEGSLYTFATSSRGGLGAIGELCRLYAQHRKRHPDVHPMIALGVGSYQHQKREYGRIKFPKFTPMGWEQKSKFNEALIAAGFVPAGELPVPEPDPQDEFNDEVPF
jgi:hypothetical protein